MDGIRGKVMFGTHVIFERVESKKKAYCKGRTGAEPSSRRKIGKMMYFDPFFDAEELKAATHGWVLNC